MVLALTSLALVAAACTSSDEANETTTSTALETTAVLDTTTTEAPVETGFEVMECEGLGLDDAVEVECGTLEVPANYETGEGSFTLEIVILKSTSDNPAPDPVIYLEGGPGGHAIDKMQFSAQNLFLPLAERGDVVIFDQRGAGRSRPVAACPEFDDLAHNEARIADKSTPEVWAEAVIDAFAQCGERLRDEGVSLEDINTTNNARDVEAIRQALGYESMNLLGISYGTRLGLEVMRLFPETTRSVILDSVFPHQVDQVSEQTQDFADSYAAVVAGCAAEPACAAEGDLGARIEAAVAQLEQAPMEVDIVDFTDASTETIYVDGDALLSIINSGLYTPASFTDFPELLSGIETDDPSALSLYASVAEANSGFLTVGMFYAIECADEFAFSDPTEVLASLPEDPFGLIPPQLAANGIFDQCNAFSGAASDPVMNEAVSSEIPTLILAGRFDPATPVNWAELAAETLPNSQTVIFPGQSHGVSPSTCGLDLVQQFLESPDSLVDDSCADDFQPVFLPAAESTVTEFETLEVNIGGIPAGVVVPLDWTHTGDGFVSDARRSLSILDSAELLQFAGQEAVVFSVDTTLEGQFGGTFAEGLNQEIDGDTWTSSSFSTSDLAVTSFKTTRDGNVIVLYLFSSLVEHDGLVRTVMLEAAKGFELK
jgi:pimeloyl-ACP methyl ester carboxylesterase